MNKEKIDLTKGFVEIYNFGRIKLHAYQTNDLMNDECFILENEKNVLIIELPPFHSNAEEFEKYVRGLNKNIAGKVFSDHPNGGVSLFNDVKNYASQGTINSMMSGTIRHLNDGFIPSFGADFDEKLPTITEILNEKSYNIGGFELNITYHDEDIEIELPQINSVYTHMLGHDCHSIVAGEKHANSIIEQLNGYIGKEYNLVLSSHYTPETIDDVKEKMAKESSNGDEFKEKSKSKISKL